MLETLAADELQDVASEASAPNRLSVVVDGVATDSSASILNELKLVLDDFDEIVAVEAPAGFALLKPDDQVDLLMPVLERSVAALWNSQANSGLILVKRTETGASVWERHRVPDGTPREMALAVREILAAAMTPPDVDAVLPPSASVSNRFVDDERPWTASSPEPFATPDIRAVPSRFGIGILLNGGGEIKGEYGPGLKGGLGALVHLFISDLAYLQLVAAAGLGPSREGHSNWSQWSISCVFFEPEVRLGMLWRLRRFLLGPYVGVGGARIYARVVSSSFYREELSNAETVRFSNAKAVVGVTLAFVLNEFFWLTLDIAAADWIYRDPVDERFYFDEEVAGVVKPHVSWDCAVSIVLFPSVLKK